jgi:predicted nuclease of restriction endonuclease-like (RecB) superfamily
MMNDLTFKEAAAAIRDAIVRSRYQAARLVNRELLGLYYAVGRYVADNSRMGTWGKGAIRQLSYSLQRELPGLRGFSESSIKRMREFYEQWSLVFPNRPSSMGDLALVQNPENAQKKNNPALFADDSNENANLSFRQSPTDEIKITPVSETVIDLGLLARQIYSFYPSRFAADEFFRIGFTHHSEILAKEKSLQGRLFYISRCAAEFWTVDALKSCLRGDLYAKSGTMPSNFLRTLPEPEQARRAIRAFKDEYLLDFINIEDEIDPDERLLEHAIIAHIKQFILSFGNKFCFIGNQYRVLVSDEEFFIDLLFFNRELRCLVAVELKRGAFKPSYLGQLNFYLSALDEYVRQEDEAPSIGILLCKEARRSIVEFAVRDYTKPMGVATYRTRNEMPAQWQSALPDFDEMRKLLDSTEDGQTGKADE